MEGTELEEAQPQPPEGVDQAAFTLAYLASHEAQCPACGYNVHKLTQPRCPECGRPLTVQIVIAARGYTVPWGIMLLAAGLAAGVGLLVAAATFREGLHGSSRLYFVLIYFMCNIPVPLVVVAVRRWFVRSNPLFQWILTSVFLAATMTMFGWFLINIG